MLFDQKVFEVPYGLFFFLLAAQLASNLSTIRSADARSFDRLLKAICDQAWPSQSEIAHRTFPNDHQWFEPTGYTLGLIRGAGFWKLLFSLVTLVTMLVGLLIIISPIISGLYYLFDWHDQIVSGDINLQYYVVLASTILTIAWFINYFILHALTEKLKLR